jgi:hypothetical protein
MIACDSHPLRQELFERLRRSNLAVRLMVAVHGRTQGSWLATLLVTVYGLKSLCVRAGRRVTSERLLAAAVFANARRQVDRVAGWLAPEPMGRVEASVSLRALLSVAAAMPDAVRRPRHTRRSLHFFRVVSRRHGFLVACRLASTVVCYARAVAIMRRRGTRGVVVSSNSNPEELAFTAAAERLGMHAIFVSHAYPNAVVPPLRFSLSLLEGEAAAEAHRRVGPIAGEVVLCGVEGVSVPMDASRLARPAPTIGVFLPKTVDWPAVRQLVADCRTICQASAILIRSHPDTVGRRSFGVLHSIGPEVVETSHGERLEDVAQRCDWAIASPGSNAHLQVLKMGVPTIAVTGLSGAPGPEPDPYHFQRRGIVFSGVSSLRELSMPAAIAFYGDDWALRFRQFDASYLRPPEEVRDEVRAAVARVLDGRDAMPAAR